MTIKGKLTPKLRERVLALLADGMSLRESAAILKSEGTPVSHVTVQAIARSAGVPLTGGGLKQTKGALGPGRPAKRPAAEDEREDGPLPEDVPAAPDAEEAAITGPMPVLSDDASPAARMAWADLKEIRELATKLRPQVIAGQYPANQWASLKGQALRTLIEFHKMTPPPKPDPAKDPMNLAARATLHAHVLSTTRAVEARSGRMCPECRKRIDG